MLMLIFNCQHIVIIMILHCYKVMFFLGFQFTLGDLYYCSIHLYYNDWLIMEHSSNVYREAAVSKKKTIEYNK